MAEVASAYVSILPSARGFGSKLNSQVSGDLDSSGKKAGSRFGAALKAGATAGLAALGVAAVKILGDSVSAASEAQQAVGGVQAVFGKYADSVLADSKKAADGLGLSAAAYNELITVSGAMLKNKGLKSYATDAKSLITVGADLSAMFGGTTKDAVDALNAAMRGESDPIEKYGIALNATAIEAEAVSLGLVKNVKNFDAIKAAQNTAVLAQRKYNDALKENGKGSDEALAAESSLIRAKAALSKALEGQKVKLNDTQKAQAALSLVQKQSADATGAFARESDTLAGQQQRLGAEWDNLKVTLGTALLPALTDAAGVARTVLDNFDVIGPVLATVAAGMVTYKVASLAAAVAAKAQAAGTTLATGATVLLNGALRANPIGIVVTSLTLLAAGFITAYKKSETFRSVVKGAIDGITGAFKTLAGWAATVLEALGKAPGMGWAKDAAEKLREISDQAKNAGDNIKGIPSYKSVSVSINFLYPKGKPTKNIEDTDDWINNLSNRGRAGSGRSPLGPTTMENYGRTAMESLSRGIAKGGQKSRKALEAQLEKMKSALATLKNDFAALAESVSTSLVGDLFGVSAIEADAEKGILAKTVGQSFIDNLMAKKGELTGLLASFKTLVGWGVPSSFLSQLFASGNGALITELAGMGQAGAVSTANLFGEVQSLGSQLGNAVAANDYGPDIRETTAEIKELRKDIAKLPEKNAKAMNNVRLVLEGGSAGQRAYLRTGKG